MLSGCHFHFMQNTVKKIHSYQSSKLFVAKCDYIFSVNISEISLLTNLSYLHHKYSTYFNLKSIKSDLSQSTAFNSEKEKTLSKNL